MQKWEYLHAVASLIDANWYIYAVSGSILKDSERKELYTFLQESGDLGWELVSEYVEALPPTHQFTWAELNTNSFSNRSKYGQSKETKQYLNRTFTNSSIKGVIEVTAMGNSNEYYILFEKVNYENLRRFTFKRPFLD
jgi:hypothetical protein